MDVSTDVRPTCEFLTEWRCDGWRFDQRCLADMFQVFDFGHTVVVDKVIVLLGCSEGSIDLIGQVLHAHILVVTRSNGLHQLSCVLQSSNTFITRYEGNSDPSFLCQCETIKNKHLKFVPADEQSPPRSASSVWQGSSGAAQHWPAWCNALLPGPAALPENKNTNQGEATTEQHTDTYVQHTRACIQQQGKSKSGKCTSAKSNHKSHPQTGTCSEDCANTSAHRQPASPPPQGMQEEKETREKKHKSSWVLKPFCKSCYTSKINPTQVIHWN